MAFMKATASPGRSARSSAAAVGTVIGGFEGLFGVRPVAAVYPEDEPRPYRHRVRHSYHHVRHTHTTG